MVIAVRLDSEQVFRVVVHARDSIDNCIISKKDGTRRFGSATKKLLRAVDPNLPYKAFKHVTASDVPAVEAILVDLEYKLSGLTTTVGLAVYRDGVDSAEALLSTEMSVQLAGLLDALADEVMEDGTTVRRPLLCARRDGGRGWGEGEREGEGEGEAKRGSERGRGYLLTRSPWVSLLTPLRLRSLFSRLCCRFTPSGVRRKSPLWLGHGCSRYFCLFVCAPTRVCVGKDGCRLGFLVLPWVFRKCENSVLLRSFAVCALDARQ